MFLQGHYQNAYVTHDLDKVMEGLSQRYGLKDHIIFEPEMVLKTPQGDRPASVRAALVWRAGYRLN